MIAPVSRTAASKRSHIVIVAVGALLALPTSQGRAQNTFCACFVPSSGTTYRIKTADTKPKCESKHGEFSWKDVGASAPQGPQGLQGAKGDPGDSRPQGPAGASILSVLEFHSADQILASDGRFLVQCAPGNGVFSFGYEAPFGQFPATVFANRPGYSGTGIIWGFRGDPGAHWVFH